MTERVHITDCNVEAVQDITAQYAAITGTVGDISNSSDVDTLFQEVQSTCGSKSCSLEG